MLQEWYRKLTEYFPSKEMKSEEHFLILLSEKSEKYRIEETENYILACYETDDFLFIDYVLVNDAKRGKGTGTKVLDDLKQKKKAIILEVEPPSSGDRDSQKRVRFYEKNDFVNMADIAYERIHPVTKENNQMNIYAWLPSSRGYSTSWVYKKMQEIYAEVHSYQSDKLYGVTAQPVSEVLWVKQPFSTAK